MFFSYCADDEIADKSHGGKLEWKSVVGYIHEISAITWRFKVRLSWWTFGADGPCPKSGV